MSFCSLAALFLSLFAFVSLQSRKKTFKHGDFAKIICIEKILLVSLHSKVNNMAIQIISAKIFATKLKATIQASGRLGFTEETAKSLDLPSVKYAKFAQDDEKGVLYLIIINEGSEDAFPIRESSGYFYVPAKLMFDMLGFDYENNNIMFDLIRQSSLDNDLMGQVYLMKQRSNKRKSKKNEEID